MDLKEKVLTILGVADGPMQPDLLALLVSKDKQEELNKAIVQLALAGKISVTTEGISLISSDEISVEPDSRPAEIPNLEIEAADGDFAALEHGSASCVQSEPASIGGRALEQVPSIADAEVEPEWPWPELADEKPFSELPERLCPELLKADSVQAVNDQGEPFAPIVATVEPALAGAGNGLLHALSSIDSLPCKKNSITKARQAGVETIADLVSLGSELDVSGHVKAVLAGAVEEYAVDLTCLRNGEQVAALRSLSGSNKFVFDPLGFLVKAPNLKPEFAGDGIPSAQETESDVYLSDILNHEPTLKRLRGAKILTVAEFEAKSHDELLEIRGFGLKKLQYVVEAIESWRGAGGMVQQTAEPMSMQEFLASYSAEDVATVESAYASIDPNSKLVSREPFIVAMIPYAIDGVDAICGVFWKEIATKERLRAFMEILSQNSVSREAMLSGEILIPDVPQWIDAAKNAAKMNGWDFDSDSRAFGFHIFDLEEWLDSIDPRAASILKARFSNNTLDEVGKRFGMTRERVRQIASRELGRRPALLEDRYAYFVSNYTMSEDEFCRVTDLPPVVFGYLMETAKAKKSDRKPLSEAIEDTLLDQKLRDALAEADLEGFVVIDGTQVPLKRYDVTLKLVELGTIEGPMSFDDLLESFVAVLDGAGVPLDATIRPDSPRAYSAWLVRQDGIIFAPVPKAFDPQERCIRLFDYNKDFTLLENALDVFPNRRIACTSGLLFESDAFKSACEALDIRNMYELHQLLRQYCAGYPGLVLGKSPSLTFGDATHMEQMQLLIGEIGPVSGHDLAAEYANRYAMDPFSVEMNQLKEVSSYLSNGMYSFGAEFLPDERMSVLRGILNKDVSLISDVRAAYKENYPHCAESDVSFPVLLQLGYELRRNLVVRQGVDTRTFFGSLLDSATSFAEGSEGFPSEYFKDPDFISELNIRLRSYKIAKLDSSTFETVGALGSITGNLGIAVDDLARFTDNFLEFMESGVPHTICSAIAAGFDDPLIGRSRIGNLGFTFLENVASIGFVGGRLKRTSLGNVAVFVRCVGAYNVPDFLNYLLLSNNMSTAEELRLLLEEEYGINVTCAALRLHMARIDSKSEEDEE